MTTKTTPVLEPTKFVMSKERLVIHQLLILEYQQ